VDQGANAAPPAPTFSRVELVPPAAPPDMSRPVVEVEMPTGVTVRVFTQTPGTLDLLSSLCGIGGGR
jgi:hypothetical protein